MDEDEITEELSLNQSQANSLYIGLVKLITQQKQEIDFFKTNNSKTLLGIDQEEVDHSIILLSSMNVDFATILPDLQEVIDILETRIQTNPRISPKGIIY